MKNKFNTFLIGLFFGLFGAVSISQAASLSPGDVLTVDPSAPGEAGVFKLDSSTWQATLISSNGYFSEPMGIALSNDGKILIGDPQYPNGSGSGAIFKIDPITGMQTILSSGNLFTDPRGIAVAANGDIFVADPDAFNYYGGVIKVDPDTGTQTKIYQSADINAGPIYLAFEANGNLVVSDVSGTSKGVVRVNPATGIGVQLAAGGNFVYPLGIAVAANGDIFVADNGGKIIKIDPVSGAQTVIASSYPIVCPAGIAFDNSGDLLVSDPCNEPGAIIKVNPITGAANVVANNFGSISPNGIVVVPEVVTPPPPPPQGEETFQPSAGLNDGTDDGSVSKGMDTYVSGTKYGDSGSNFGDSAELTFDYYWDYNGYPLLKFDVSTLPSNITSAKLYLYSTANCGGGSCPNMDWTVNAIASPWNEMTATWNANPTLSGSYGTLNIPASPSALNESGHAQWVSVDITTLYNGWKNGTIPNYGVGFTRLGSAWDGGVWFNNVASSDYEIASLRPKLVIEGGFPQADTQPPIITVPAPITIETTSPTGTTVTYEVSATDNVGVTSFACAPASGSTFPLGDTTVICNATDAAGNAATPTSFVVHVVNAVSKDIVVGSCSGWCGSYGNDLISKLDSAGSTLWTKSIGAIAISINPTDHSIVVGDQYGHVKKLDSNGNVLWDKNFNVSYAWAVSVNPSNGSIVAGISSGHMIKLDSNGNILWDKNVNVASLYSVSVNPSNGGIVAGGRDASGSGHVIKLDSNGNVLWDKNFNVYQVYKATVSVNYSDGSIAVGTPSGLIKLDSNGNVLWNKNTGYISETVSINPSDGSIAVGTWTSGTVIKIDSNGNILWNKSIGANALVVSVSSIDGSIAVGTQWYNRVVKLDSSGNTLWDKNMGTNTWSVAVESYFAAPPDLISPIIAAHADVTAEATSASGAVVTYTSPTTSDAVDGAGIATCLPASGSTFPIGNTTVTCNASDAAGNLSSASFNVTIEDTTPPTISAPADIIVPAGSSSGASGVALGSPAVSDIADLSPTVTNDAPAVFPIGTTIVVWTAQDQVGNSAQATQQVVVLPLPAGYTEIGANVSVILSPDVNITFSSITGSGITNVITSSAGPAMPTQFKLGNPPIYYDINTTAVYNPPVEVCFSYAGVSYQNENNLKLRHFDGINWLDITSPGYPDKVNKIICGSANSLSPFAITEPAAETPPQVINVKIDIKPGSYPNSINSKSNGKIPVAILSSAAFNALTQTDKASLTFGRTGDEKSLSFCNANGEDVNNDGLLDLVCHFQTQSTNFRTGDTEGKLKGKTIGGTPLAGKDSLRLVPAN